MQQKYLIVGIVLIALLGFVFLGKEKNTVTPGTTDNTEYKTPEYTTPPSDAPIPPRPELPKMTNEYTLDEVKKHNQKTDCWTAVNGSVYDVTEWIAEHPGGADAIISLCGTDGSSAFSGQHGGQKRPASELASFKIGTLK